MSRRLPLLAILLTVALVAARVLRAPPLYDPLGAPLPPGVHLGFPVVHLLFAPLFDLWDAASMLSLRRLEWMAAGLLLVFLAWRGVLAVLRRRRDPDAGPPIGLIRELSALLFALLGFVAFIAGGMLWHRPMVALRDVPPAFMTVDLHSHSNVSHDVMGTLMAGFDTEASRRWHRRAGYDAFFLTDHNTVAGLPAAPATEPPFVCPGIEISSWRAHIVLLGTSDSVDRSRYGGSLEGVLTLLRESESRYGAISIASLPEYDQNHFDHLDQLIEAGIDGFEIVNASPKAAMFSRAHRDSVTVLATARNLLLVGVSDNHGWGATNLSWNLVRVPGWKSARNPCPQLLNQLATGGIAAVQIAERHHLENDSRWPLPLTPEAVIWETWRSLTPLQTVSWLFWIWVVGIVVARRLYPLAPSPT
ncbi:MAG: hypothetical protein ABI836_14450 [Gemmatimonadota bacterium]